jgi:CDP-diglyceride synthetase
MKKNQEKSIMIINVIICVIAIISMCIVSYLMRNMEWWKFIIALFIILICVFLGNTFNIVYHIKKKK